MTESNWNNYSWTPSAQVIPSGGGSVHSADMPTFSELAESLSADDPIVKLAEKMGKKFTDEFNRRMKEVEEGKAIGLYRPWDDEPRQEEKFVDEPNTR